MVLWAQRFGKCIHNYFQWVSTQAYFLGYQYLGISFGTIFFKLGKIVFQGYYEHFFNLNETPRSLLVEEGTYT